MSNPKALGPDFVVDDQGRLCHAPQPFDEFDDDLMHDVMGNERLAKPVQALLVTLKMIEMTQGSFGADEKLALAALMPDLKKLREACREEWLDQ